MGVGHWFGVFFFFFTVYLLLAIQKLETLHCEIKKKNYRTPGINYKPLFVRLKKLVEIEDRKSVERSYCGSLELEIPLYQWFFHGEVT